MGLIILSFFEDLIMSVFTRAFNNGGQQVKKRETKNDHIRKSREISARSQIFPPIQHISNYNNPFQKS